MIAGDLVPYDPNWPEMFEEEALRLRRALGHLAVRIDHHGSTAVSGLSAKPVIDIQVSVANLQPLDAYERPLEMLGYTHLVHPDDAFSPFFHRPAGWPHTHHIHVVQAGGNEEWRTLAFRDYLRNHDAVAREYERLKHRLMTELQPTDTASREAYAAAKTDFVERVITLALASESIATKARSD
jgi:GrpB-like predicted nucleotidyltransferase (UPF0157 family)